MIRPPSFFGHLLLLWKMRLRAAVNGTRRSRLPPALVHAPALLPGLILAVLSYSLMVHPAVAGDAVVTRFFLGLLCFVAALVWIAWPILSAGVDDHSELSRYVAFPISRLRLLVGSTLSGLLEPIAFVVHGPVLGAMVGHAKVHGFANLPLGILLFLAFLLMCAFWSRVGLHLVLKVLRSHMSAEALGGSLLFIIVCGLLLPPVDTSWMYGEGGGLGAIDLSVLANAGLAFGRVPSGYLSEGLRHMAEGRTPLVFIELLGLLAFTAMGVIAANSLLSGSDQSSGRAGAGSARRKGRDLFSRLSGSFAVLALREALDFWRNPRARLLAGVPFVLAVLLRLLSGRDLFAHFLGHSADAWLMGGLSLYASVLVLSTFAQNAFAYDEHGLRLLLASPVSPTLVLRAKNLVHGTAALALGALVCGFYLLYLGQGDLFTLAMVLLSILALVPVGLAAGNFLSVWFPVKFHASLQRRDKPPLASAILGLGALGAGALALPLSMAAATETGPGLFSLLVGGGCAAVGWAIYAASMPLALLALHERREQVLSAVTRA